MEITSIPGLITEVRLKLGLSIEALAKQLGGGWPRLINVEAGKVPAPAGLREKLNELLNEGG